MSDLSVTGHNLFALLRGDIDFNQFLDGEGKLIEENIASTNAAVQPFLNIAFDSFKATASNLVGAGESALGPIINTASDTQATMLLNLMTAAGIPTLPGTPLSAAEHAGLVTLINGLKAMLDRMHLIHAAGAIAPSSGAPAADPALLAATTGTSGTAVSTALPQ